MNSRILTAMAIICACLGISLLSSACTTMAVSDTAQAVINNDSYSQSLEWSLENWLDDYDRDLDTAAEAASGALTWRIVGGFLLIVAAAFLMIASSAQTAGLSIKQALKSSSDQRQPPPENAA